MPFSSTREDAISAQDGQGNPLPIGLIVAGLLLVAGLVGGGLFFASGGFGSGNETSAGSTNKARSYRTIAKTELRSEANQASRIVASLREGTTVSGIPAGNQDGVDWLEITAVDGTKGFVPKTLVNELGPSNASTEIRSVTRRIVTSTTVNLRETPSLSGKVLGVADGGTRMVSDGIIQSEGEDWMRVPLDGQTTVYIMSRFTTSDDDGGSGDGFEGSAQAAIGVRGFATLIANVQATPMGDARIVRALQLGEEVRIIGQTNAGRAWYVLRLADGSQGFAPREAIRIDPNASQWVYPDGTVAPGPNVPKGSTVALNAEQLAAANAARQASRAQQKATQSDQSVGSDTQAPNPENVANPTEGPETGNETSGAPQQLQPKEAQPIPGPQ